MSIAPEAEWTKIGCVAFGWASGVPPFGKTVVKRTNERVFLLLYLQEMGGTNALFGLRDFQLLSSHRDFLLGEDLRLRPEAW